MENARKQKIKNQKLEGSLTRKSKKLRKIKQEISNLKQELDDLKKTYAIFDEIIIDKKDLVEGVCQQDNESFEEDNQELQEAFTKYEYWFNQSITLAEEIKLNVNYFASQISKLNSTIETIKNEEPLATTICQRFETLKMIERMLDRTQEPTQELVKNKHQKPALEQLTPERLLKLFYNHNGSKDFKTLLRKELEESQTTRYQPVRELRNLAEQTSKQWLNIVDKKILPILDALDESQNIMTELLKQHPQIEEILNVCQAIHNELLKTLEKVHIKPMLVLRGDKIDYECHVPLSVETDENLTNETIKSLARNGYEYKDYPSSMDKVLRPAQIVAVKNNN